MTLESIDCGRTVNLYSNAHLFSFCEIFYLGVCYLRRVAPCFQRHQLPRLFVHPTLLIGIAGDPD